MFVYENLFSVLKLQEPNAIQILSSSDAYKYFYFTNFSLFCYSLIDGLSLSYLTTDGRTILQQTQRIEIFDQRFFTFVVTYDHFFYVFLRLITTIIETGLAGIYTLILLQSPPPLLFYFLQCTYTPSSHCFIICI